MSNAASPSHDFFRSYKAGRLRHARDQSGTLRRSRGKPHRCPPALGTGAVPIGPSWTSNKTCRSIGARRFPPGHSSIKTPRRVRRGFKSCACGRRLSTTRARSRRRSSGAEKLASPVMGEHSVRQPEEPGAGEECVRKRRKHETEDCGECCRLPVRRQHGEGIRGGPTKTERQEDVEERPPHVLRRAIRKARGDPEADQRGPGGEGGEKLLNREVHERH